MVDGIVENQTASMTEPYLDVAGHVTDNRGKDFIDPEVLKQAVVRLDALGFQPHFHALGDRAVRQALDAVEAARRANGWSDTRPHLAHLQVVHPDDLARFRRLGALANAQPYWAVLKRRWTELTLPILGPSCPRASTRSARFVATGPPSSWARTGACPRRTRSSRWRSRSTGSRTRRAAPSRSCPRSASSWWTS